MKVLPVLIAILLLWPAGARPQAAAQTPRNVRGIHTLARESSAEVDAHLGWARLLVGDGGYVTQPFTAVGPATDGPTPEAVRFVERAYALGLTPIVRLQGAFANRTGCDPSPEEGWSAPVPDDSVSPDSRYHREAAGYRAFVEGLPRAGDRPLYVQVGNEPNLHYMWGGRADPAAYARFFVDVSAAIRSLGDDRIKMLNAGLAPQGDVDNLDFIRAAITAEPAFGAAFDSWASHSYPHNQPPEHNLHDGTALPGSRYSIDAYLLELETLRAVGTPTDALRVVLTETGYQLGERWYPEYPPITEDNRADYTRRAFEQFWPLWTDVQAVTPFQLTDPNGSWKPYDWVWPTSTTDAHSAPTRPHLHYARLVPGTGVVRGLVTDSTGTPLKDVAVAAGASGHLALTVEDGSYVLIAEPGTYELTVQKTGYAPAEAGPVSVVAGGVARLDVALRESLPATVQNSSFESGDLEPWTVWGDVDGVQGQGWYSGISARHKDRFLGTAVNCGEKDGGVYQAVATQPGRVLRLGAWLLTYREGDAPIGSRISLDPRGGTDPDAQSVVWSDWADTGGRWRKVTVSAVAAADRITIFLQHDQSAANRWNISAFDAVELGDGQ